MVLIQAKCQHIKEALQEQELDLNALLSLTDIDHYHSFVTKPLKLKMGSALRLWQELEKVRSGPTTATNGSTSQDAICIDDDDDEPQQPNNANIGLYRSYVAVCAVKNCKNFVFFVFKTRHFT